MATVPVTPAVVSWAVDHSGYTIEELAKAVKAEPSEIRAWLKGTKQPKLGKARALAKKLRRPLAIFLSPEPPSSDAPAVAFRAPVAEEMRDLNSNEQRYIRQASRIQDVVGHLHGAVGDPRPTIPMFSTSDDVAAAARQARSWLGTRIEEQITWSSDSAAFREWRSRLETHGILVFALALGGDSVRGMTLASDHSPVIIVNTHFNPGARIYSLFHELGHVLTATTSACAASWTPGTNQIERWCDGFAANALMPWDDVCQFLESKGWTGIVDELSVPRALAKRYKVSLSAATLCLINGGRAKWPLWQTIPRTSNDKSGGGATPDEPRKTSIVRLHEFGTHATGFLVRAMRAEKIDRSQVASYLRVDDWSLSDIERRLEQGETGVSENDNR